MKMGFRIHFGCADLARTTNARVLHRTGLVTTHRVGPAVRHTISPIGTHILTGDPA
jgi:hypothetical protein